MDLSHSLVHPMSISHSKSPRNWWWRWNWSRLAAASNWPWPPVEPRRAATGGTSPGSSTWRWMWWGPGTPWERDLCHEPIGFFVDYVLLWDIQGIFYGISKRILVDIYIYNCNKMGIWMGVAMEKIGLRMGCKSQSYEDLSRKYGDWMGRNRRYHQQYRISPWKGDVSWNIVRISWEFHEIFLGILMGYCQGYHGDIMR